MGISARSRTVLSQVVTLHYRTCGPVGSALVSKARELSVSPATIRNIMMRLESRGYLSQPHTSAGRVPTDLGYRTYVDGIKLSTSNLAEMDCRRLDHAIDQAPNSSVALKQVADYVERSTDLVTFHLPFRHCGFRLGHMHLEYLGEDRLLAVWVARGGQTFQSMLRLPDASMNRRLAEKTANFFNQAFVGKNLLQIQQELRRNYNWDVLLRGATSVTKALIEDADEMEPISVRGISKVLGMPEFHDVDKVRSLCRFLEEQDHIKRLIQRGLAEEDEWVHFYIGGEMDDPEMEGLAMALGKFRAGDDWVGCVGTLGPKRMPYLRALQILRYAQERLKASSF